MAGLSLDKILVRDAKTGAKGMKTRQLAMEGGGAVLVRLGTKQAPMRAPFGLSSFQESSPKKTLDLDLTEEEAAAWDALDTWAKSKADGAIFCGCVVRKEGYPPRLRVKVNPQTRFWDETGKALDTAPDLKGGSIVVSLRVGCLWSMSGKHGISVTADDVQVLPRKEAMACPFE